MLHYINAYLFHCKVDKQLSAGSIKAYSIDLFQFMHFLSSNGIGCFKAMDKSVVQLYVSELSNLAPSTTRRKVASLKAFCSYLEFEDVLRESPFRSLRIRLKMPSYVPTTLSIEELNEVLNKAYNDYNAAQSNYELESGKRNVLIIEILIGTGLRVSELCSLKRKNFDKGFNSLIVSGKGRKQRVIPITHDRLRNRLMSSYFKFPPNSYLFTNRNSNPIQPQSVRAIVRKCSSDICGKEVTPHVFRHSFATQLLEQDTDIRYIQGLLGHSSITTTQIYTKVSERKKREVLETNNPLNFIDIKGIPIQDNY